MIDYNPINMCLGRDGKMSLTRTAACTAHLLFALTVAGLTIWKRDFMLDMWSLYISITVLHASYDKTAAMVADFKVRKMELDKPKE